MTAKQLLFAKPRMRAWWGMNILADAVRVTLGPKRAPWCREVVGRATVINSGVAVAKEIELEDRFENMGAQMVRGWRPRPRSRRRRHHRRAARRVDRQRRPEVRRGRDEPDGPQARHRPRRWKRWSPSSRASRSPAPRAPRSRRSAISANNDSSIGDMIAEAMEKVEREGVITVEDGKGLANELEVVEGTQFDRGFLSPYFITNAEKQSVVLEDAHILLYDKKISDDQRAAAAARARRQDGQAAARDRRGESKAKRSRRSW